MNELRRIGNAMIVFGVMLLVCATILVMYNIDQDGDVGKATVDTMAALSDEIVGNAVNLPKSEDEAIAMRQQGRDVIMIDDLAYIGYLTVPSQSLELPILSECTTRNLKVSPCRYSGSAGGSHFVLAGHNYRSHFGKLTNLHEGDTLRFTNVFGAVFEYKVVELQSLRPTSVESMKSSDYDLSLFTCNLAGNARFTVRCMRTK